MSVVRKVRLRVPAGTAKPGPAIGQVRGWADCCLVDDSCHRPAAGGSWGRGWEYVCM